MSFSKGGYKLHKLYPDLFELIQQPPYIINRLYLGLLLYNSKLHNLQAWTQATANTGLDCTTCLDRGRRGNHKLAEFAKYPFNFLPVCDNLVTSRGLYLVNTSWPNDDNILTTTLPSE